jgi:hypothetical protein
MKCDKIAFLSYESSALPLSYSGEKRRRNVQTPAEKSKQKSATARIPPVKASEKRSRAQLL